MTETAHLVVGADGKHSMVAHAVRAPQYRHRDAMTVACYSYWSGVPLTTGELYQRPGCAAAAFPTNEDLTIVYVAVPITEFRPSEPTSKAPICRRSISAVIWASEYGPGVGSNGSVQLPICRIMCEFRTDLVGH